MKTLSIDIETYSGTDLGKCGVYKYVEDPDFEILLIAYSVDGEPVQVQNMCLDDPDLDDIALMQEWDLDFIGMLTNPEYIKTAWNAAFEITCLSKYFGIELDPIQWDCSMIRAANAGLPLSLGECAKVMNLSEQKMTEGKALVKYFCEPCKPTKVNGGRTRNLPEHAPEKWAKFIEYCRQDVVTENAIRSKLGFVKYTETERKLWRLDQMINRRGVEVDMTLVQNAIDMDAVNREMLIEESKDLTGLDNPNSNTQLAAWLGKAISTPVTSLTKESVLALVETVSKGNCVLKGSDKQTVLRVLDIKQKLSKTSVKKYEAMNSAVCSDNRVKGLLQFYGANRTGRWAGRLVQLQNLPRNMMKDLDFARNLILDGDSQAFNMWYSDLSQPLSELIRTAFVPKVGHTFAVADFSAIEARVVAWLAGEEKVLDVFRTHGKIYEKAAAGIYHKDIKDVTKQERAIGKVAILALGFAGGVGAFQNMARIYGVMVSDEEADEIKNAWRNDNPNIVKFWRDVQNAALRAVRDNVTVTIKQKGLKFIGARNMLFIELPSGRRLSYVKPRIIEGKYGPSLQYWGINSDPKKPKNWALIDTHGGKLVENITQGVARDCLAESMLALDSEGVAICMHIHDETVNEIPAENQEAELKRICEIMGREIPWAKGLPLKAEGYLTPYYKKD